MQYMVNDRLMYYEASGDKGWGKEDILLHHAVDLTAQTNWSSLGYTIEKFLSDNTFNQFIRATRSLLLTLWKEADLPVDTDFRLEHYHTLITDYKNHLRAIEKTKQLSTSDFPI